MKIDRVFFFLTILLNTERFNFRIRCLGTCRGPARRRFITVFRPIAPIARSIYELGLAYLFSRLWSRVQQVQLGHAKHGCPFARKVSNFLYDEIILDPGKIKFEKLLRSS